MIRAKGWKPALYNFLLKPKNQADWIAREKLYERILTADPEQPARHLEQLLRFAKGHVPYYADLLAARDDGMDHFHDIPVLTKEIIHQNFQRLQSEDISQRKCITVQSSGSTGNPQKFLHDETNLLWSRAASSYYYKNFMGMEDQLVPRVRFWNQDEEEKKTLSSRKKRFLNWLGEEVSLDSIRLTPEKMAEYAQIINKIKPVLIRGTAGCVYRIAQFIKENNIKVHSLKRILVLAEMLYPHMRECIEETFKSPVFDFYGTWETRSTGGTCRQGAMHLFDFNNRVEVVDENNRPVTPGQRGKVLVTTLHNYAMPLIRYDIGDIAVQGNGCSCGSRLPALEKLVGRQVDYFTHKSGELIDAWFFIDLMHPPKWIKEFQILQKDFDKIEITFIRKSALVESERDEINRSIKKMMGEDCAVEWDEVGHIPASPSGKLLFTRSLVTKK